MNIKLATSYIFPGLVLTLLLLNKPIGRLLSWERLLTDRSRTRLAISQPSTINTARKSKTKDIAAANKLAALARELKKAGRYDDAIRAFEHAVRRSPNNLDYLFELALLHTKNQDERAAKMAFNKIVELNPRHTSSLINLAILEIYSRNYDRAKDLLQRAKMVSPNSWRVYYNLGRTEASQSNWSMALSNLKKALILKPGYMPAQKLFTTVSSKLHNAATESLGNP